MHSRSPPPGPRSLLSCPRTRETDFAAFASDRSAPEWASLRSHYPRCPECAEEVARWSRLDVLLRSEGAGMAAHPSEHQLLAYQAEPAALEPEARTALEAHLAACAPCRSELRVLAGFDFAALESGAASGARGAAEASEERRTGVLEGLGERIFGLASRPVWAVAVLLLVVIPVALFGWWIVRSADPTAEAPPSVARSEIPEPRRPETVPDAPAAVPDAVATPDAVASAQDDPAAERSEMLEPASRPDATAQPDASAVAEQNVTPAPEQSDPAPVAPEPALEPVQIAALLPAELPRYVPDAELAGGSLEVVRVEPVVRAGSAGLPRLRALAPPHTGASADPAPELYWHLSAPSPVPVEIAIFSADDEAVPLLDLWLEPPVAAGLHEFRFSDHALRMTPGVTWYWFVALVPDREKREDDVLAGAAVRHVPLSAELASALAAAPRAERAHRLAAAGYWFDAFATFSAWSDAEPQAANLRAQRAALLEQVELGDLAAQLFRP